MANENENDPIADLKKDLDEAPPAPASAPAPAPAPSAPEPEPSAAHEKQGEELRVIDTNVKKLCEDVESWKTETKQTLSQLTDQVEQSQKLIRELSERKPEPEPQAPTVVAIAPAPEPAPEPNPSENADAQKDQKTGSAESAPAAPRKQKRFV